ncbi:MAG: hypothetical protein AB1391_02100 [Candidatus Micrarchaeota archaeon]
MENKNILIVVLLVFVLLFGCLGTEQQPPKEVLSDLEDFSIENVVNTETDDEQGALDTLDTLDIRGNIESLDDDVLIGKGEMSVYEEAEIMETELSETDSFNGDLELNMTFEIDIDKI